MQADKIGCGYSRIEIKRIGSQRYRINPVLLVAGLNGLRQRYKTFVPFRVDDHAVIHQNHQNSMPALIENI